MSYQEMRSAIRSLLVLMLAMHVSRAIAAAADASDARATAARSRNTRQAYYTVKSLVLLTELASSESGPSHDSLDAHVDTMKRMLQAGSTARGGGMQDGRISRPWKDIRLSGGGEERGRSRPTGMPAPMYGMPAPIYGMLPSHGIYGMPPPYGVYGLPPVYGSGSPPSSSPGYVSPSKPETSRSPVRKNDRPPKPETTRPTAKNDDRPPKPATTRPPAKMTSYPPDIYTEREYYPAFAFLDDEYYYKQDRPSALPQGKCYCNFEASTGGFLLDEDACKTALYRRVAPASYLTPKWLDAYYDSKAYRDEIQIFLNEDCIPSPPCTCLGMTPAEAASNPDKFKTCTGEVSLYSRDVNRHVPRDVLVASYIKNPAEISVISDWVASLKSPLCTAYPGVQYTYAALPV